MGTKTVEDTKMTADGAKLLGRIVDQQDYIESLRDEQRKATRKLAELCRDAQNHPDPALNYSTAAKAIGFVRSYTAGLVKKLEAGQLG